jgi:hypothetical protein
MMHRLFSASDEERACHSRLRQKGKRTNAAQSLVDAAATIRAEQCFRGRDPDGGQSENVLPVTQLQLGATFSFCRFVSQPQTDLS